MYQIFQVFTVMMITVVVGLLMIMHRMPFYSVGHPTSVEFVSFGPNFGRAFFWPGGAGAR